MMGREWPSTSTDSLRTSGLNSRMPSRSRSAVLRDFEQAWPVLSRDEIDVLALPRSLKEIGVALTLGRRKEYLKLITKKEARSNLRTVSGHLLPVDLIQDLAEVFELDERADGARHRFFVGHGHIDV